MEQAKKLLEGKFHEEEDDDDDPLAFDNKHNPYADNEELSLQNRLERFQRAFDEILNMDPGRKEDEIDELVRKEFNIPDRMGAYTINFNTIRKDDVSKKRKR